MSLSAKLVSLTISLIVLCSPLHAANSHKEALLTKSELDTICRIGGQNISVKNAKISFLYDEYVINVDDERCGINLRYAVTIYRSESWAHDELKQQIEIVSLGALPLVKPDPSRHVYYSESSSNKALFLIQHDNVYMNINYSLKDPKMVRPLVRLLKHHIDKLFTLTLEQSGF